MSMTAMILGELRQETASTRRLLQAIPDASWDWKPHAKSMTLGRLAGHTAEIFGWAEGMLQEEALDLSTYAPAPVENQAQALAMFEQGAASILAAFEQADPATFGEMWSLKKGDEVVFSAPRLAAIRSFVINHLVHHRGQLTVYLRLLDVALPQVYGPTADSPAF